ncbi:MAG TPA: serine/threonine-protein phosphatase [Deltaproteobacteria bacterium]|nr:serine/threonine-protein phosphatase [Deltaproteobacteria bacterium]
MSARNPWIQRILSAVADGRITPAEGEHQLSRLLDQGSGGGGVPQVLVEHHEQLAATLEGLERAITEFRGISGHTPQETEQLLRVARRRFAIHLSAIVTQETPELDASGSLVTSASLRTIQRRLSGLAHTVAELMETTIRDSNLRHELQLAGLVQRLLVPSGEPRRLEGCEIHPWFEPAEQSGGDWWTMALVDRRSLLLMIGDVTGHGAPAAIVTGAAKGATQMALLGLGPSLFPHMLLNMLNQVIIDCVRQEYMMSGVALRLELAERTLTISNAAHPPPLLLRAGEVVPLMGDRSSPVGATRAQRYDSEQRPLSPGDLLVLFTDGVIECRSPEGRPFGERRLREVCRRHQAGGAQQILDGVRQQIIAHRGGTPAADDLTFLVIQVS